MDKQTKARLEARAAIIKAMAHPSRLYMLECLQEGPLCVCELTALVGSDKSTVSKHLSVLKNAGVVTSEKHGAEVHYTLRISCIHSFFACIESLIKMNLDESRCLLV